MSSPRRPLILLAALPALLVGCSSAAPAGTPSATPPPAISANPTPVSTAATSAPATTPPTASASCPAGEYKATSFVATALSATSRVKVTDIDAEFRNGQYTFDFDDDHPVNLTVGKSTQKVRIDGEIRGSYSGDADALTFTRGTTSGTAKIKQNGATRSFPMREVAEILAPQGKGSAVCKGNELTLKADGLTWQMVRDDD